MIPKVIHYCWFGKSKKPVYVRYCIKSWKRYFSDFEIIEWNESNTVFDHPFVARAYQEKRWAFVSDFVRIQKLKEHGGVYLDTDMYFLKPMPDHFLTFDAFVGAENRQSLSAGVIGSMAGSRFINSIFEFYAALDPVKFEDVLIPSVLNSTIAAVQRPIIKPQEFDGCLVLDASFFYPLPLKLKQYHWKRFVTTNTIAVHLWAGSWLTSSNQSLPDKIRNKLKYHISKWYVPQSFLDYARNQ